MRAIQVSDAVYAKIWSLWRKGDTGEDSILQHALGVETDSNRPILLEDTGEPKRERGYYDKRHRAWFPEGFEIFRKEGAPSAKAVDGGWYLNGKVYPTLNRLSTEGLGIQSENAWINWFFRNERGQIFPIDVKRDRSTVVRRRRTPTRSILDI